MKKLYIITLLLAFISSAVHAHEMTPTYPKWRYSFLDNLLVTEMEMFNKRADVEYYEIAVFDENWNPVPFVSSYNVYRVEYLSRVRFEIYIREQDRIKAEYICSKSKLRDDGRSKTSISSTICSRLK
jgi:hypothetical protein